MLSKEELLQISICLSSNIYSMLAHFTKFFKKSFQGSFRFTGKLRKRYTYFPYFLLLHTCIASLIINVPHQNGTFVTTDDNILTHHYYLKSVLYTIAHSWWCTFYWFKQMYNDMYLPLQYLTEYFHYHKIFCVPVFPPHLQEPVMALLFPQSCHFQNVIQLEYHSIQPFQISFLHLVVCI